MITQTIDDSVEHSFEFEVVQENSFPELIASLSPLWSNLSKILTVLYTEAQYQRALKVFDGLVEVIGDSHTHPLSSFMEILALLLANYEREHYPMPDISGEEILQFLMEQNALTPKDLPELGNPSEVSDLLTGKRLLNTQQVRTLSERFQVSPALFF